MKSQQRAFTLIECILALAIVCSVAFLGVPSLQRLWQRYHVTTTAQHLMQQLRYAKHMAIALNTRIAVVAQEADWQSGYAIINLKTGEPLRLIQQRQPLTYKGFPTSDNITFYPNGIQSSNGHFVIAESKILTISAAGRIHFPTIP